MMRVGSRNADGEFGVTYGETCDLVIHDEDMNCSFARFRVGEKANDKVIMSRKF